MESNQPHETQGELTGEGPLAKAPAARLDDVLVQLDCFEPNSKRIQISGRDLTQHTLIVGSTGSGKTSAVIFPMIRDLIAYQTDNEQMRNALIVYDTKLDGTTEFVTQQAQLAGRGKDLVIIGEDATHHLQFVPERISFDAIQKLADQLSSVAPESISENHFWTHQRFKMLEATLALYFLNHAEPSFLEMVDYCTQGTQGSEEFGASEDFKKVEALIDTSATHWEEVKLRSLLRILKEWDKLDPRTKSNAQATISNILSPLLHGLSAAVFSGSTPSITMQEIMERGHICVIRLPAVEFPTQSKLIAGFIKALLSGAAIQRQEQVLHSQRLVAVVMDEYPLVVTGKHPRFGDVRQLQTLRSKGVAFIAATQGYHILSCELEPHVLEALLVNFGNLFYLRVNEPAVHSHALDELGLRPCTPSAPIQPHSHPSFGLWDSDTTSAPPPPVPICPHGALAQLEEHQCFYRLANGARSQKPHHLVPYYVHGSAPLLRLPQGPAPSLMEQLTSSLRQYNDLRKGLDQFYESIGKHSYPLPSRAGASKAIGWEL